MPGSQQVRQYAPGPPLSAFVRSLWIHTGYSQPHAQERVLPTGTVSLLFSVDAGGRMASGVVGARSEFSVLDTSRPFSAIGVQFSAGGAFPFFGVPGGELHNRIVPLHSLWGGYAAEVQHRLWEAQTPELRFRILERTLLERMRGQPERHPAVSYALELIDRSRGTRPVGEVIQSIGISSRRFVELFRNQVGLSPKLFCRIRRFTEALREIERSSDFDWVDIALACGYFDQAHFNHDFRAFCGLSPSAYLRLRTSRTHVAVVD
jgi:AraC-like DNA-binding protein